jgi:hypothetical protein
VPCDGWAECLREESPGRSHAPPSRTPKQVPQGGDISPAVLPGHVSMWPEGRPRSGRMLI